MKKIRFIFLFIALFLTAYKLYGQFPQYLYGIASWYGQEYAGNKTASGEIYDPMELTAAHQTLPFGTKVEVENLETGAKVVLKINDRGPFIENRIIDVSERAAELLEFKNRGTTYVKVAIISLGSGEISSEAADPSQVDMTSLEGPEEDAYSEDISIEESITVRYTITNTITRTVTRTNLVLVTNEVVQLSPLMEDRAEYDYDTNIIERDIDDTQYIVNEMENYDEQFIIEEPLDEPQIPIDDALQASNDIDFFVFSEDFERNIVNLESPIEEAPENNYELSTNEIVSSNALPNDFLYFVDEGEITPELLISEDGAIDVEEFIITDEALSESKNTIELEVEVTTRDSQKELRPRFIEDSIITNEIVLENPVRNNTNNQRDNSWQINGSIVETNQFFTQIEGYAIQVGAFKKESNALDLYERLRDEGFNVFTSETIIDGVKFVRVRIGYFDSKTEAQPFIDRLSVLNLPVYFVKNEISE